MSKSPVTVATRPSTPEPSRRKKRSAFTPVNGKPLLSAKNSRLVGSPCARGSRTPRTPEASSAKSSCSAAGAAAASAAAASASASASVPPHIDSQTHALTLCETVVDRRMRMSGTFRGRDFTALGSFVTGSVFSPVMQAFIEANLAKAEVLSRRLSDGTEIEVLTLRWVIHRGIMRFGLSGGCHLCHSELSLPGDQIQIQQNSFRGQTRLTQELSTADSAGTIQLMLDGEHEVIGVWRISLSSGHFKPTDVTEETLGSSVYLSRFVKAWHLIHGGVSDLCDVLVNNHMDRDRHVVGMLTAAHVDMLRKMKDPFFTLRPFAPHIYKPVASEAYKAEAARLAAARERSVRPTLFATRGLEMLRSDRQRLFRMRQALLAGALHASEEPEEFDLAGDFGSPFAS